MNKYFKIAGDLPQNNEEIIKHSEKEGKLKYSYNIKKKLEESQQEIKTNKINKSPEEIQAYLNNICSGVREEENIKEAGTIITTLEKLYDMVEKGYNIVTAEYLANNLVSIEFQKINKRGRRF